jgi:iron complex transport system ATP-binding protein
MSAPLRAEGLQLAGRHGHDRLRDVTLELPTGTLQVLIGPNGAGKSSLLAVLAGSLTPRAGQVYLHDKPLSAWTIAAQAEYRAVLPQQDVLGFPLRVDDVVQLGRWRSGTGQRRHDTPARLALMAELDLLHLGQRLYSELSGGEQRRVQLARVLFQIDPDRAGPGVLLLDEPLASLDLPHQHRVMAALRRRCQRGWAVLCALHDLDMAVRYADRLLALGQGRLLAPAVTPAELDAVLLSATFGDSLQFRPLMQAERRYWRAEPRDRQPAAL